MEGNTKVHKGIREREGITIKGQAWGGSRRGMVNNGALSRIPPVPKRERMLLT